MAELAIAGGAILTMDAANPFVQEGSVVVEDGLIAQVTTGRVAGPDVLDASGCVVLPGLVNAHSHLFLTLLRGVSDDLPLEPWLDVLSPAINGMTPEQMRRATAVGCREALRMGTTCICECCRYAPQLMAEEASRVGLRCLAGGMPASEWFGRPLPTDVPGLVRATRRLLEERERFGGLVTPYIGVHSTYNCSPEFIVAVKQQARELGVRFNIHLAETRTEVDTVRKRYGKSPTRFLHDLGVLDEETILDHCVWLTEEDMDILSGSGAGVVHCPASNAKLVSGIAPITGYLRRQIPVALATDSVVSNNGLNMFDEMRISVLLQRVSTSSFAYTAVDALRAATIGGARVLGLEEEIGSIVRGKRADLLVLRFPPEMRHTEALATSHIVYSASPLDLLAVIVGGRVVVREARLAA